MSFNIKFSVLVPEVSLTDQAAPSPCVAPVAEVTATPSSGHSPPLIQPAYYRMINCQTINKQETAVKQNQNRRFSATKPSL